MRELYLSVTTAGSQPGHPTASHDAYYYRTQVYKANKVFISSMTLSDTHSIMTGLMSRSEGQ